MNTDDNNVNDEDRSNWDPRSDDDDQNPIAQMKDEQRLAGDDDTPFSPPSGTQDRMKAGHPATDADIDKHEHYDEGREGASGADLPGQAADEDETEPPLDEIK